MSDLIKVENEIAVLDSYVGNTLAVLEMEKKKLKKQEDDLKQAILEEMESKNIINIDTDLVTINYIAQTDRETFDSKAFKKDHADMYDEYVSMKPVKASVRVKVK